MGEEAELMVEAIKEGATMPPTKESGRPPWGLHDPTWQQYIGQLEAERDALREALLEILGLVRSGTLADIRRAANEALDGSE